MLSARSRRTYRRRTRSRWPAEGRHFHPMQLDKCRQQHRRRIPPPSHSRPGPILRPHHTRMHNYSYRSEGPNSLTCALAWRLKSKGFLGILVEPPHRCSMPPAPSGSFPLLPLPRYRRTGTREADAVRPCVGPLRAWLSLRCAPSRLPSAPASNPPFWTAETLRCQCHKGRRAAIARTYTARSDACSG